MSLLVPPSVTELDQIRFFNDVIRRLTFLTVSLSSGRLGSEYTETDGDVTLPEAQSGLSRIVTNSGVSSINITPINADRIGTQDPLAPYALAAGETVILLSPRTGQWWPLLGA